MILQCNFSGSKIISSDPYNLQWVKHSEYINVRKIWKTKHYNPIMYMANVRYKNTGNVHKYNDKPKNYFSYKQLNY